MFCDSPLMAPQSRFDRKNARIRYFRTCLDGFRMFSDIFGRILDVFDQISDVFGRFRIFSDRSFRFKKTPKIFSPSSTCWLLAIVRRGDRRDAPRPSPQWPLRRPPPRHSGHGAAAAAASTSFRFCQKYYLSNVLRGAVIIVQQNHSPSMTVQKSKD